MTSAPKIPDLSGLLGLSELIDIEELSVPQLEELSSQIVDRLNFLAAEGARNSEILSNREQLQSKVDAALAQVPNMEAILSFPSGAATVGEVQQAAQWLAEAVWAVGDLAIVASRLSGNLFDSSDTMPDLPRE